MDTNENILKLQGKVNIPDPLTIGENYKITIQGSITGDSRNDNFDGTVDTTFKFEPVLVEILTPQGVSIKAKDKRKLSQKLRGRLFLLWKDSKEQMDFEDYYEVQMTKIIGKIDEIIDFI